MIRPSQLLNRLVLAAIIEREPASLPGRMTPTIQFCGETIGGGADYAERPASCRFAPRSHGQEKR